MVEGVLQMGSEPLDLKSLLADAGPWQGLAPETRMGHVHLQVADVEAWLDRRFIGAKGSRFVGASFNPLLSCCRGEAPAAALQSPLFRLMSA